MSVWNLTPEQRRASVQKGLATKRRKIEERDRADSEAAAYALRLRHKIDQLEKRLEVLTTIDLSITSTAELQNIKLHSEEQIVKGAQLWEGVCGVYFLVKDAQVVYVGQSVNVFSRIASHAPAKSFDSYAFVLCEPNALDALESLYIHVLKPPLNGNLSSGAKCAPLTVSELCGGQSEIVLSQTKA